MYIWSSLIGGYGSTGMDQPGKVANPARGLVNREMKEIDNSLSPFAPENLVSRKGFGRLIPRRPAHSPH